MATCYSSDALCSDIRRVHTCDQRRVFITQHKDYNVSVSYWHVSSPCAVWLSAIPNRLRLNRVTRKYFVFRVTFNTMCSIIVVLWLSAFINSCYAQRRCVSVMYSTQIPWLQHKFRFVVVRWLSATTIRLRLNRATREDYVFRVTVNTMCSIVVVRSVHVSNMIMR